MAATEPKLKITAYVEPQTLRMLVRPQQGEGLAEALRVFAGLVAHRTDVLALLLSVYDWEYLQLACESICMDELRDGESWHGLLMHAMDEAREANGHHLVVWRNDPEGNYKLLRKTAAKFCDLDAVAVLAAVRFYFNQDRETIIAQGWWEVQHRVRPKRAKVAKARKAKR